MSHAAPRSISPVEVALDVTIEGADGERLADGDLRRLFPGSVLTGVRLNRLHNWPRLVVRIGGLPIAVATYTQIDGGTQIPDFALDVPRRLASDDSTLRRRAVYALVNAIEMAALAGACHRVLIIPPREIVSMLERRGYAVVSEGCGGAWMERDLG